MGVRVLLLPLFSAVLALLVSEIGVRLSGAAPRLIGFNLSTKEGVFTRSDNPILGYEMKPGHRAKLKRDCHENFPFINSLGFRDIERRVKPAKGVKRILVLGDSVAAGHGVCDLEDTIPKILDRRLSRRGYEVLNLGVGGYCTRAEVEVLKTKGLELSPSMVIVLFVGNDYVNSNGEILKTLGYERPWIATKLVRASHLMRLAALNFDWWRFKTEASSADPHAVHLSSIGDDNVAEGFDLLRKLGEERGFKTTIVLWPTFGDKSISPPAPHVRSPDGKELKVTYLAKKNGLSVIDLTPHFKEDHLKHFKPGSKRPPNPKWLYTVGDGTHPSPRGAKVAARVLSSKIREGF